MYGPWFFLSHIAALLLCLTFTEENQSINQPSFCNSWWFWLMEMLDELYTLSRMSLRSGEGLNHCIWDKNRVSTWIWHTVDIYLSGVWRCFNLLKRNLHSNWGVNRVFCGSLPAGHQHMPSVFVILTVWDAIRNFSFNVCREMWHLSCRRLCIPECTEASIRFLVHLISYQCFVTASPETKCAHVGYWVRLKKQHES